MLAESISPEKFDHLGEPRGFCVSSRELGYLIVEEAEVRKLYSGINGSKFWDGFSRKMYIAGIKIVDGNARLVMSSKKRTSSTGVEYILANISEMPRIDFIGEYRLRNSITEF